MESPENIKSIYDKLHLRETMAHYEDWAIIGDLKAHNASCGKCSRKSSVGGGDDTVKTSLSSLKCQAQ